MEYRRRKGKRKTKIKNTKGNKYRVLLQTLSSLVDTMMFVVGYNKTDNLTFGQKKVVRFLNPIHAKLLFTYLTYVKPVEQRFLLLLHLTEEPEGVQQQQQPIAPTTNHHFLFTHRGKRIKDERIPEIFHQVMADEAGLPILFSDYRDAVVALFREHRRNSDNLDEVIALQTGHSQEVAGKTYGRHGKEDLRHSANLEYEFFKVSTEWQTFIFNWFDSFFPLFDFVFLLNQLLLVNPQVSNRSGLASLPPPTHKRKRLEAEENPETHQAAAALPQPVDANATATTTTNSITVINDAQPALPFPPPVRIPPLEAGHRSSGPDHPDHHQPGPAPSPPPRHGGKA